MDESTQTKTCLTCAETIKAAARICPHCQIRQGRFPLWRSDLAQCGVVLIILAVLGMLLYLATLGNYMERGRNFNQHRDELVVLRTSLEAASPVPMSLSAVQPRRTNYSEANFWLVGYLTNKGVYAWRVHAFEAKFLDAQSNLVDAWQPNAPDGLTVLPHSEHAFRLGLYNAAFTNLATVAQVRVLRATEPGRSE